MQLHTLQQIVPGEGLCQHLIQGQQGCVLFVEEAVEAGIAQVAVYQRHPLATHGKGSGHVARDGGFAFVFARAGDQEDPAAQIRLMLHLGADAVDLLRIGKGNGRREHPQRLFLPLQQFFQVGSAPFPAYRRDNGGIDQVPGRAAGLDGLPLDLQPADQCGHGQSAGHRRQAAVMRHIHLIDRSGGNGGIAHQLHDIARGQVAGDRGEQLLQRPQHTDRGLGGGIGHGNDNEVAFTQKGSLDLTPEIFQSFGGIAHAVEHHAGLQHFTHHRSHLPGGGHIAAGGIGGFSGGDRVGHGSLIHRGVEPAEIHGYAHGEDHRRRNQHPQIFQQMPGHAGQGDIRDPEQFLIHRRHLLIPPQRSEWKVP